jgi:hypothetical protein
MALAGMVLVTPGIGAADCVLTCPDDIERGVPTSDDSVVVEYEVEGNADCGEILQVAGLPSGAAFPVGEVTNMFEDGSSEATCMFQVIVKAVGSARAPATGTFGLAALVASLAAFGIRSTRRRRGSSSLAAPTPGS